MNWEAIGAISDSVGAAGVIVTLIYLAIQITRNTKATRQQSYNDLVARRSAWMSEVADNREMTVIFYAGAQGELTNGLDSQRFLLVMINFMSHFQDAYLQFQAGIVEEDVWQAERKILAAVLHTPGVDDWWHHATQFFMPDFVKEVARIEPLDVMVFDQDKKRWTRRSHLDEL
jgi:hypothetical protein